MTLTPEQFNKLATKDDLKNLEQKVDGLAENVSYLVTAVDGIVHEMKNINSELTANIGAHDRFEDRITKIEKKLNPNPAF